MKNRDDEILLAGCVFLLGSGGGATALMAHSPETWIKIHDVTKTQESVLYAFFRCQGKFYRDLLTYYRRIFFAMSGSAAGREPDLSFLGESSPLPTTILPSKGDVIRYAKHLRTEAELEGRNHRNYPTSELAATVARDVFGLWNSLVSQFSSPVTIEMNNLQRNVQVLLERAKVKSTTKGKEKAIEKLFMESEELFEIVSCR